MADEMKTFRMPGTSRTRRRSSICAAWPKRRLAQTRGVVQCFSLQAHPFAQSVPYMLAVGPPTS